MTRYPTQQQRISQYKAFYTKPADGVPFEEVKKFNASQLSCFPSMLGRCVFNYSRDKSLDTLHLYEQDAQALCEYWNRACKGKIIYSIVKDN